VSGITQRLKLFYAVIFTLGVIVAFLLRFYGQDALINVYSFQIGCTSERCFGVQAAYRVSFSLALFFFLMALITFCAPVSTGAGVNLAPLRWRPSCAEAAERSMGLLAAEGSRRVAHARLFALLSFAVVPFVAARHQGAVRSGRDRCGVPDPWR